MRYKTVNNLVGWIAFAIAAFTYCSTIEPSASYWDCPEFISSAFKLEVGHPPGAPMFMITANLFTQLAHDTAHVAMMVNTMSALLSAACILFLFWTITHLSRKLIVKDGEEPTLGQTIEIMGAGMVGALAYTWSDTFWFSAVEGEVYAYSSMFTALVFWLILKWENRADEAHSDRWLVLIAFLTGLSIGVHLLNLLCIPAIVLIYVYKKKPDLGAKGSILALLVSFVLVAVVLYGVVPGIVKVGGWFELFFVNTLGFSFNTGLVIYIILLVACVIWAIYESQTDRSRKRIVISATLSVALLGIPFIGYGFETVVSGIIILGLIIFFLRRKLTGKKQGFLVSSRIINTTLLCFLMLMIGYSSYAIIVIRSVANPPMDQNSPEDVFTLGSYLNREQYGGWPLLYGQAYTSRPQYQAAGNGMLTWKTKQGKPIYNRKEKESKDEKDKYVVVGHNNEYLYAQNMLFPRMWDADHASAYESWMGGVEGKQVPYDDPTGQATSVKMPTQIENLRFFFSYQLNFMYWRYFMWNFAGRQNDIQGNGEPEHGNWISGFSWLDNMRLGDQSKLPDELKENKGHNVFYCLPLLLGIIGLVWQLFRGRRGERQFWVVGFLFFMTGLAIVIYLNQTPMQPRERDYAYAGSFYAYAIWCGLGVAALIDLAKKHLKLSGTAVSAVIGALCLLVPVQMASQTWDDHDRSGRYTCRDFGQNYLMTLQDKGNPIIFTNGDNDTFPLWYDMDVEGIRTDARVCNLSYLNTDWYIDQMKRPAYTSPGLPITWPRLDYCSGTNEYVRVDPSLKQQVLEFYKQDPAAARKQFGDNPFDVKNVMKYWGRSKDANMHVIPTDTLYLTIDKNAVRHSGMMLPSDTIPDKMVISLAGKSGLGKGDLMMLEIISQSNWVRPVYVACTVGQENYMNLGDNFIQEGLAYRISPFTTAAAGMKKFDTEKTYRNMMFRYKYGGLEKPGLYIDETVMRMCYTHRRLFGMLALNLIAEGKRDKALKALQKCGKVLPEYNVPMNYESGGVDIARAYALLGKKAKALEILGKVYKNAKQYVLWYTSLNDDRFMQSGSDCLKELYMMNDCYQAMQPIDKAKASAMAQEMDSLTKLYQSRGGSFPSN